MWSMKSHESYESSNLFLAVVTSSMQDDPSDSIITATFYALRLMTEKIGPISVGNPKAVYSPAVGLGLTIQCTATPRRKLKELVDELRVRFPKCTWSMRLDGMSSKEGP